MVQKIPNDMLVSGGGGGSVASETHAASSKATPVDADEIPTADSESSFAIKKLTWANIKATIKSYFDTLYQTILVSGTSIKTVNGASLLGSGDISLQTPISILPVVNGGSGTATPSLVAGSNVSISGTWPNQTIASSGGSGGDLTVVPVSGSTQTAVAGNHYILTNVAATTVTLPASPASGDTVWVTWTNSLATNVIARNGSTIMGDTTDMTLDAATNGTVQLRFVNSSWRIL